MRFQVELFCPRDVAEEIVKGFEDEIELYLYGRFGD